MNASLATVHPVESSPRLDLPRLLWIGAVMPAAIAGVNYAVHERGAYADWMLPKTWLVYAWYVVQVGIVGISVGRGFQQVWLKYLLLGWNLLLVDLLACDLAQKAILFRRVEHALPAAALVAGQMGLCTVWGAFGDWRWLRRIPAMTGAAAVIFLFWMLLVDSSGSSIWTTLLEVQLVTLMVLCVALRLLGFRLQLETTDLRRPVSPGDLQPLQFGIKHVFLMMTALAILLGVAKALNPVDWFEHVHVVRAAGLWKVILALFSAMGIVAALWTALGRGYWAARYAAGALLLLSIGAALAGWSLYELAALQGIPQSLAWRWRHTIGDLRKSYEIGWWWLGWVYLSGGLLAATLIILRTQGYRLVRLRRHRQLPVGTSP